MKLPPTRALLLSMAAPAPAIATAPPSKSSRRRSARPRAPGWLAGPVPSWTAVASVSVRGLLVGCFAVSLAVFVLTVGERLVGYHPYTILSGSMGPALEVGSFIVDKPVDASTIQAGDIITFHPPGDPGRAITHRVVRVEVGPTDSPSSEQERYLVTKGDANAAPDAWRVPGRGMVDKVVWQVPLVGYVTMGLETSLARVALLFVPAIMLTTYLLTEIWRPEPVRPTLVIE